LRFGRGVAVRRGGRRYRTIAGFARARGFFPACPMSASAFLQIRHIVKDFDGHRAVDDVSIDIAKGEVFALLGSSGCGKTTLLRMLAGFETPTSGSITLDGRDLAGLPPYERPMNMMFQSYALFPHLTVFDNIAFGLKRDGLPAGEIAARVEAMLKLVQLGGYAKRKPHQLSGGQQQRVALARSLAKKPQLLLLDEPLGALDRKLREETQIELANIIHDVGVTCVMVTHDQEEAMTMASRIAVMSAGRFLQVGAPAEIYETPTSRFVADFIGNVNLMDGTVVEDESGHVVVDCGDCEHWIGHGITGTLGMKVSVALRPEKIRIQREAPVDSVDAPPAPFNRVRGKVKDLAYFGSFTVYHLRLASGRILKVSQSNSERQTTGALSWDDEAWASWAPLSPVVLTQ
jgi:putrescine transport system ATP-binding protein